MAEHDQAMKVAVALRMIRDGADHNEMTANAVIAFLTIASRPGCSHSDVAEVLGLSAPSVSRLVGLLGSYYRGGQRGLGLIEMKENVEDRRLRQLFLSPEGTDLWEQVRQVLRSAR